MTGTNIHPGSGTTGQAFRGFRFSDLYWYLVLLAVAFVLALAAARRLGAAARASRARRRTRQSSVARLNLAEGSREFCAGRRQPMPGRPPC
jgi:cytochrome c biogenesis protein ResB